MRLIEPGSFRLPAERTPLPLGQAGSQKLGPSAYQRPRAFTTWPSWFTSRAPYRIRPRRLTEPVSFRLPAERLYHLANATPRTWVLLLTSRAHAFTTWPSRFTETWVLTLTSRGLLPLGQAGLPAERLAVLDQDGSQNLGPSVYQPSAFTT